MPMKLSLIILTFWILSFEVYALKCSPYKAPNGETLKVEVNKLGLYKITAPAFIEDNNLIDIDLFVSTIDEKNISVPIAFEIKNGMAQAEFGSSKKWPYMQITARYSDLLCGPRLEYVKTAHNKPIQ